MIKMDLAMRHKIIQKIVNFMLLIIVGGMFAGLFTALENTTFLLCFISVILLIFSYAVIRMNRIGDTKKGTKIIRGRVYAEYPFYSHFEKLKVVYEYYVEYAEIKSDQKKAENIIAFKEERIARQLYMRDDFGKILLDSDGIRIRKFEKKERAEDVKISSAYWRAQSSDNVTDIEHDELLHGQLIVAVGQLSTNYEGQRILTKFEDQPYFIASTGLFHTILRSLRIVYCFWLFLFFMTLISTILYYIPNHSLTIMEGYVISVVGDSWQQLLNATIQQPREVVIAFVKYILASLPFIILIFFKTPIFQRIIMPMIYANLSWLILMLCAFAVFHIFLLNITIMWLMLGIFYCVLLVYFIVYINYLRTQERQDINSME